MGQLIIVDEDEYNDNKILATWAKDFVKEVDEICEELYPNRDYWIDTGSSYNVALAQLDEMYHEIKRRRRKWFG